MIFIDYKDRRPIYEQIVERFQMLIVKGILEPDSQMPSVRKLATDLAINPNTIQKAYAILEQNGFIYPVKGRGNFVTGGDKLVRQKQEAFLAEFREQARQAKELGIAADALRDEILEVYAGHADDRPQMGREHIDEESAAQMGREHIDEESAARMGRERAGEERPAQTGREQEGRREHDSD